MTKIIVTRLIGLSLLMGALGGTLCQAQNDNGRFVSGTYIALLGRGADSAGWTFWVGTDLNAGVSQDNMVSQLLTSPEYLGLRSSFQRANGYGCGWPADWNGQFVTMLYYYGLNRCPDPSGFAFWKGVLDAGYSPGTVVWDFVNAGSTEFNNKHGAAVTAFLAAQPSAAPSASAVWFGAQPGGSDSVPVLFDGLYRSDFYDFQGSSEITQATVFVGSGAWYNGNCAVRYTPATQTVDLLDDNGNPQFSGTMGQTGIALANSHCHVDLGSSSVSSAGTTMSLYLYIAFIVPGNGYGWYGQAKALPYPYGVSGPYSSSLGSMSVTGTVAPAGMKGVQEDAPPAPPPDDPTYWVINNGAPKTWTYCLTKSGTPTCAKNTDVLSITASQITSCSTTNPTMGSGIVATPKYPSADQRYGANIYDFDVTFTASNTVLAGTRLVNCLTATSTVQALTAKVEVYDATPAINPNGIAVGTPDFGTGAIWLSLYGANFGKQPTNVQGINFRNVNTSAGDDFTVLYSSYWSPGQINVQVIPKPQAGSNDKNRNFSADYDTQVTTVGSAVTGADGQGHFRPFPGATGTPATQPTSNTVRVAIAPQKPAAAQFLGAVPTVGYNYSNIGPNGAFATETFALLDQFGHGFWITGLVVEELVTNEVRYDQFGRPSPFGDGTWTTPQRNPATDANIVPALTADFGTFLDFPFGSNDDPGTWATHDHKYRVFYGGYVYELSPTFHFMLRPGTGSLTVDATSDTGQTIHFYVERVP